MEEAGDLGHTWEKNFLLPKFEQGKHSLLIGSIYVSA